MDEIKAKQQVIEKIKESSKILVAVSDNPSVDALSAAIGLTMLLDKQDKYTTAIFSGETPPAIAFLEPEKTFDDTTDSLRDFIIALNKEKADHLRYKVDGDSVKIFITPYKTVIDQNDLEFSQGDYNVDLVIALGVDNPDHLDRALENHGQILHDAAIITVTAGDLMSDLGGIDWHDAQSSSLSEMISGLSEAMKNDKKKSLIDSTIATALLTGIVAETDRFSNERTTSRSMTVAAKLMSAGADQQLIATKLQDAEQNNASEINDSENTSNNSDDSFDDTREGDAADTVNSGDSSAPSTDDETSDFLKGVAIEKPVVEDEPADPSRLNIKHEEETLAELDRRVRGKRKKSEKTIENIKDVNNIEASNDANDSSQAPAVAAPSAPNQPIAPKSSGLVSDTKLNVYTDSNDIDEPLLGGTLNATTEQAAEDSRREAERDQNKTILSHAYLGASPIGSMPNQSVSGFDAGPSVFPGTPPVAPGSVGVNEVSDSASPTSLHEAYAPSADAMEYEFVGEENGVGGERVIQPLHEPASAPSAAMQAPSYVAPAPQPVSQPAPQPAPTDFGLPVGAPTTFAPPTQPQLAPSPFMQPIQPSQPAQSSQPIQPSQLFQPAQPLSPSPSDLGLPLPPPLPDFAGATAQAAGITAIPLPNSQPPELLGDILNTDNTSEDAIVPPSLANPINYPVQSAPVAPINQAPSLPPQGPADPAQFQIPT